MVEPQHRRPVEFLERYYICRTTEKYSSNFSISVRYNHRSISKALLSHALHQLITNNSWFVQNYFHINHKMDDLANGTNYEVRILDSVKFEDAVSYKQVDQFDASCLEFLNDFVFTMKANLPLWKVFVFEESDGGQVISVCYDHSHFDGLSGVQFQKDLAKELSRVANEEYFDVLFDYRRDFDKLPKQILPARENLTDLFSLSWTEYINLTLKKHVPYYDSLLNYLSPSSNGLPIFHTDKPVDKNLKTRFRILKLKPDEVDKISKYCRSIGVTLTSYFDIICLKSLQETVFTKVHPSSDFNTSSLVAINGRRYYSDEIKNFLYGCMVCGAPIILPNIKEGDNLEITMKKFHAEMTDDINSKKSFKAVGVLKYTNMWDFFKQKLNKIGGRYTLTISNLGKIGNSNDTVTFEEMYFTSNTGVVYNFVLNMTTLPNGELTVVFGNLPEFENHEMNNQPIMDEFLSVFKSNLLHLPPH
ncbi:SPAC18B11.03c Uncharacterized protein C18B11.03c [Candida maltosa Xu316]|uniref:Alcohol acetyltransferase n=1 Tax=Candida maltosa (strain Xu316) TaxID=1245528 RepID=M3J5B0_CANMX|nr:hypothetical protein G210_2458 [Candida maltosa Xu316]